MAKHEKSDLTKSYKHKAIFMNVLSTLLMVVPLLVFSIFAFMIGEPHQKFALGITITVALILFIINIVNKIHLRSAVWIVLLGLSICLTNIEPLLIIMALTTLADELIVVPLHDSYKSKYTINDQIDRRL